MVLCKHCKYSTRQRIIDDNNTIIETYYYCHAIDCNLPIQEAEDDLPCDLYDEELDDNETEESSA